MKPALKKEWLEALRSGDYQQGREYLCRITPSGHQERFCCLGVLADIGLDADWLPRDKGTPAYEIRKGHAGILMNADRKEVGLSSQDHHLLIGMNDRGATFADIADWIEENVK